VENRYGMTVVAAAVAAVIALSCAPTAAATDVYVADGAACSIAAYTDTVPAFLSTQELCFVEGMAIDRQGKLLVAAYQLGVARVDPATSEITVLDPYAYQPGDVYPDCLSDDVYFVTYSYPALYVLPGGTGPGQYCMSFDRTPVDIQVYPSGDRAGHLLVLFESEEMEPAYLAEFRRTGPTSFEVLPPALEEATEYARGFAIRPDGRIVLLDQETGMYDVGPGGQLTHFGPSAGLWGSDIDIGADGTIYVVDGEVSLTHRFDPDGHWILPSLNTVVDQPRAVAAVGLTPSPPGEGVPVIPVEGVELLFESVAEGGFTWATTTTTTSRTSPGGNTLPEYAAAPAGRDGFTYVSLATTAAYENLIQVDVLLPGSRLFFAHGMGEVFQDVTVEGTIEDARGVISRFSEVVAVDDSRPLGAVVDDKFARLHDILSPDIAARRSAVESAKRSLRARALTAERFYRTGATAAAINELGQLNDATRAFAGSAIPNSSASPGGNLAGEILSRSKTLMFSLSALRGSFDELAPERVASSLSLACGNPARGECRMTLAGPAGSRAVVTLHTVSGRFVRTLYDGVLSGGVESLVWDGADADGWPAASGVYFARVESGGDAESAKVVFVR